MGIHADIRPVLMNRATIEAEIERLIEILDVYDGDPDLEPEEDRCRAADDGCGRYVMHGHVFWGSVHDEDGVRIPHYGPDQTAGPIDKSWCI